MLSMWPRIVLLVVLSCQAIVSGTEQVPKYDFKNLEFVDHEFLDVKLPSFVAQGYSRRLLQADPTPAKDPKVVKAKAAADAAKGVTAGVKVPNPSTVVAAKGPAKPAKSPAKTPAKSPAKTVKSPAQNPAKSPAVVSSPAPQPETEVWYTADMFPAPPVPQVFKGKIIKIGYEATNDVVIPKGAKDVSKIFNKALEDIAEADGGELHIGPGEFLFRYQFVIQSSNTLVKGAGMDLTIIKLADFAPGPWKGAGFLRWTNEHNITVTDLTLDGNKEKQFAGYKVGYGRYGIYMHGYKNALFLRVRTRNFQRYGFDPHGQKSRGAFIWSYGLTVIDCESHDNNWDGFTFDMTNGIFCAGNYARGNGRHGFNIITGSKGGIVYNNTAVRNGLDIDPKLSHGGLGCGFMTDNYDDEKHADFPGETRDILYFNNTVKGADVGGFCAKSVKNVTMTQNVISGVKWCMFFLDGTVDSTFKNNICIGTPLKIRYRAARPERNVVKNITYV